ncbi:MAG: SCP2 sterol-binding domain-containing protein [Acidimicrobiales bacterium]
MTVFLSREWLDQLGAALAAAEVDDADPDCDKSVRLEPEEVDHTFSLGHRVTDQPGGGEVFYVVELGPKRALVVADADPRTADVELSLPWPDAVAVSQGRMTPGAVLSAGRLQIRGNVALMVAHAPRLARLARAAAALAAETRYP